MLPTMFFTLSAMVASAIAAPFQAEAMAPSGTLVVVDPKVTSPTQDTLWVVGNQYNVTWDNSVLPPLVNITNVQGEVVLGQLSSDGEKLDLDHPLAQGFLITDSHVVITVPKVADGDYIIVLLGDSGNQSPQFQIVNDPGTASTLASTSFASGTSSSLSDPSASATSGTTQSTFGSIPALTASSPSSTLHSSTQSAASTVPTRNITATNTAPASGQSTSDAASSWTVNFSIMAFTSTAIVITLAL